MRVISLDPSLRSFGVYSVEDGEEFSEVKVIPASVGRLDALGKLLSWLSHLSAEPWDLCIVEHYAFNAGNKDWNGRTASSQSITTMAEIGGIVRGLFRARKVPVLEMQIGVWKAVTGIRMSKGTRGENERYIEAVAKLFKRKFATTDECDAFLMYHTVKKCGTEPTVGDGAANVRAALEAMNINAKEM
jgi:hypothetical protein